MTRRLALGLAWVCAAAALAAFFLPWVKFVITESLPLEKLGRVTLEVRQAGRTVTTDLAALSRLPGAVSGAEIPRLARDANAQTGLMVLELLTGRQQHAEAKSLAVYLVPGLACLSALLLTAAGSQRHAALGVAAACALIAAIGAYKLLTVRTAPAAVAVSIGPGLWISVGAYVGLAASGAIMSVRAKGAG